VAPAGRRQSVSRKSVFLLFVGVLCALAVGCLPASAQDRSDSGVYRRPLGNDPESLDPARISDIYGRSVAQQIFDGLVQFDQTLAIAPALAQFWKASRDGLVWTFTLRKGVTFHHGREMTADDVVYSFTRILDPKVKSGAADLFLNVKGAREFRDGKAKVVAGLVALDRYTVQVTLTEALAPFVSVLAVGHAKVLPKDVVEQQGEAFGSHPVGTGPFRLSRWDRGRELVLTANPEYFDGSPRLSRVVYRVFPGEQQEAMYDDFRKGKLEDTPIPTHDYRRIVTGQQHVYVKRPMLNVRFYGFNTRVPPLTDRRVRAALTYAIDRETLNEELLLGRYTPAHGILPPGTLGFNPKLAASPYDPAKARELLKQAGYPNGLGPIPIWSGSNADEAVRELGRIKRYLNAIGIDAHIHYQTDWPVFSRMLVEGQCPMFLYAWYADVPDPDNFLFKLFHSRSARNFFGYANPAVDDLLVQARAASDLHRRVDFYRKAEQMILGDAPLIPMWHKTYERLFQPYVRSVEVSGLGDPYIPLRKVWLERPR
jgi:oligopeptide transport system substrate-binding protein